MPPEGKLATLPVAAPPALKPAVDPSTPRAPRAARRRVLAAHPGLRRRQRGTSSSITRWQAKNSITNPRSCSPRCSGLVSRRLHRRRRSAASSARRCRVRVSPVPAVADRLERSRTRIRCAASSSRSARASCPITRSSTSTRSHEQADAPVPGLTHRYPDKALFLALDTCPVYCRFCTRSYAVGVDTDEVEKVQLKVNEERWERAFDVHPLAARARGHRHLRRRRLPAARRADHADRRGAARDPTHPAHPLRDQGPGGDAAEAPHRRRVDRRADRASSSRAGKLHKEVVLHTHFNHPNEITAITEARRWTSCSSAASPCATRPCCSAASTTRVETMTLLVQAPRPPQRAPVLRLRARPREGRRGPAHDARRPRSTSRRHVRGATAGFNTPTVRRRRAGRRRQARRALVRALRPHDRRVGLRRARR